jgi:hypothetical protein
MHRANARLVIVFCAGVLSGAALLTRADTRAPIREPECGTASGAYLRTTYFGLGAEGDGERARMAAFRPRRGDAAFHRG